MTEVLLLTAALVTGFVALLIWATRNLPKEEWQFIAALPFRPNGSRWDGRNLTFYGLITASAHLFGAVIFLFLMGSIGIPRDESLKLGGTVLLLATVSASLTARVIERRRFTFSVAGAAFATLVLVPVIVALFNRFDPGWKDSPPALVPVLAALSIGFALGEGLGRMACLSFGCCYGRPVDSLPEPLKTMVHPLAVAYAGKTKKAAYEGGLEGQALVPVQSLTSLVLFLIGTSGFLLFLMARPGWALGTTAMAYHAWRILSEFFRADHRGGGRVSVYQWLSLAAIPIVGGLLAWQALLGPAFSRVPDPWTGLGSLWDPVTILLLEAAWVVLFLASGRSNVTYSRIEFHVGSPSGQ